MAFIKNRTVFPRLLLVGRPQSPLIIFFENGHASLSCSSEKASPSGGCAAVQLTKIGDWGSSPTSKKQRVGTHWHCLLI